jgi:hypothetical protein
MDFDITGEERPCKISGITVNQKIDCPLDTDVSMKSDYRKRIYSLFLATIGALRPILTKSLGPLHHFLSNDPLSSSSD